MPYGAYGRGSVFWGGRRGPEKGIAAERGYPRSAAMLARERGPYDSLLPLTLDGPSPPGGGFRETRSLRDTGRASRSSTPQSSGQDHPTMPASPRPLETR